MKSLIVVIALIVASRADVSHLPTGSYLPASGHVGAGSNLIGIGGHGVFGPQSHGGIQGGIGGHGGFQGGLGGHGGFQGGIGGHGGFESHSQGGFHGGIGGFESSQHGSIGGGFHGGIGGHVGGFQDQKHVYFYAAPEEHSSSRLRINIVPNSQRNTKIIFVKAPSYGSATPEVVAPQSFSEDKTLVYVLVKRPEHGGQINIPAGAGIKPAKPEVYFIKYKTQQDAHQQISGGVQGHQVGTHVPDLGSEVNFVKTLESSSHGIGIGTHEGAGSHGSASHGSGSFTSGTSTGGTFGPAGASGPY